MFTDGMPLPVDATCATTMTNSRMPDLTWTGAPAGTMSFAITFVDATMLPASTGFHSVDLGHPGDGQHAPGRAAGRLATGGHCGAVDGQAEEPAPGRLPRTVPEHGRLGERPGP